MRPPIARAPAIAALTPRAEFQTMTKFIDHSPARAMPLAQRRALNTDEFVHVYRNARAFGCTALLE
jgi:hypothetical protein